MRVCLINPPRIQPKVWGKPSVFPPIIIATVAAVLEAKHKVSIIDAPTEGADELLSLDESKYRVGLSAEELTKRIEDWKPDVVVIEIPFSGWSKTAFEVASIAKSVNREIRVVLFGLHPSARPNECLENVDVDFVVVGEPEITISELVDSLEAKTQDFSGIDGLGYRFKGKSIQTKKRALIKDLDTLPFPAHHLLPYQKMFKVLKRDHLRGEVSKPWTLIISSRGCPNSCVFCTAHLMWGHVWRARSPKNVVDEIEYITKNFGIKQMDFLDENLTLDRKRMMEICDLMIQRGIKVEWFTPSGVRADRLDEELLRKMKRAGCKKIRVAPESGVQRVVNDVMKKNLDLGKVEAAVAAAHKVGIKVGVFFVMGLIGESKAEIEETIQYAYKLKKLGAESFIFSIAMPVYGTEFYEQAKSGGYLRPGFCDYALAATEPLLETPEWTAQDLMELCMRANAINRTVTRKKIVKAMRHPRKTLKVLLKK
jgi:magnesium-protoporphyrin IX monomethyl ester (oxidative) cyclase